MPVDKKWTLKARAVAFREEVANLNDWKSGIIIRFNGSGDMLPITPNEMPMSVYVHVNGFPNVLLGQRGVKARSKINGAGTHMIVISVFGASEGSDSAPASKFAELCKLWASSLR